MKARPLAAIILTASLAACNQSPQPPGKPPLPETGGGASSPALLPSGAMKTLNDAKQAGAVMEQDAQRTRKQIDQTEQP